VQIHFASEASTVSCNSLMRRLQERNKRTPWMWPHSQVESFERKGGRRVCKRRERDSDENAIPFFVCCSTSFLKESGMDYSLHW
jgi:hypothetical protein